MDVEVQLYLCPKKTLSQLCFTVNYTLQRVELFSKLLFPSLNGLLMTAHKEAFQTKVLFPKALNLSRS